MKYFYTLLRFSIYGFITFAAFGYLLSNPYLSDTMQADIKLILYLGGAGAVSFPISAGAVIVLFEIYKELRNNE